MAGRIPQNFIDDLLDRTDIVEVIDSRVQLKKAGRNYQALCPFHKEKSPSFSVNPDKQFYYCFGCGAGGNAIGFLMEFENSDFIQTVEGLSHKAGMQIPREESTPEQDNRREQQNNLYPLLQQSARFYQTQLRGQNSAQKAINYLRDERQLSGVVARDYGIGYAPPGWDNLMLELASSDKVRKDLIESGMLIEKEEDNKCYDRFRDRIMFPIRDSRGRVIGFGGRVLNDEKPKYLNSPETPVFHKGRELYGLFEARKANRNLKRLLVVEGYMDVVSLAQHGINYSVATLGTATSQQHLERAFRLVSEVIFCFDGDNAGRGAAWKALENSLPTMKDGRQIRFLFLPDGEDPDTLIRKEGHNAFEQRIDQGTPLSDYFFDHFKQQTDISSMDGQARLSKLATPLINQIPAGVFHQLMLNKLAELTGLSAEMLEDIISQQAPPPASDEYTQGYSTKAAPQQRRRKAKSGLKVIMTPAKSAISQLLHLPQLAQKVDDLSPLKQSNDADTCLLVSVVEALKQAPLLSTGALLGHWHGTSEGETLTQLAALEHLIPDEGIEAQFMDSIKHLGQQPDSPTLEQLMTKAKETELNTEEKALLKELLAKNS